jgi:hypothetical protein
MDGHATFDQLQNAPAGTLIRERRNGGYVVSPDGTAEHRSTYRALPPGPEPLTPGYYRRRTEALIAELDKKLLDASG